MRLQPFTEIDRAGDRIGDGDDDQDDGDHSEGRQRLRRYHVLVPRPALVDADQLEEEIGESGEVEGDDGDHAGAVLPSSEEGREDEDENGNGNGGNGQAEFWVGGGVGVRFGHRDAWENDDDELHGEAEEEEEIEF